MQEIDMDMLTHDGNETLSYYEKEDNYRVNVYVRVRPLIPLEEEAASVTALLFVNEKQLTVKEEKNESTYTFDHVFQNNSKNSEVCDVISEPLISTVLSGCNASFMAYGQTGTGKTYTILSDDGIIPQTVERLLNITNACTDFSYKVTLSYLQIYQDRVYDLLFNSQAGALNLREHPQEGIIVEGLTIEEISTFQEARNLLDIGKKKLIVAETKLVHFSSRSHAICLITVEKSKSNLQTDKIYDHNPIVEMQAKGKLYLCDLAGSERLKKTKVSGKTLEEAKYINTSLLELGNVIHALATPNNTYVPFRNSTLTRILKESVGGNSKANMMICISPSLEDLKETKCSLNFGQRAMMVMRQSTQKSRTDSHWFKNPLSRKQKPKKIDYKVLSQYLTSKLKELESAYKQEKENLRHLKNKIIKKRLTHHFEQESSSEESTPKRDHVSRRLSVLTEENSQSDSDQLVGDVESFSGFETEYAFDEQSERTMHERKSKDIKRSSCDNTHHLIDVENCFTLTDAMRESPIKKFYEDPQSTVREVAAEEHIIDSSITDQKREEFHVKTYNRPILGLQTDAEMTEIWTQTEFCQTDDVNNIGSISNNIGTGVSRNILMTVQTSTQIDTSTLEAETNQHSITEVTSTDVVSPTDAVSPCENKNTVNIQAGIDVDADAMDMLLNMTSSMSTQTDAQSLENFPIEQSTGDAIIDLITDEDIKVCQSELRAIQDGDDMEYDDVDCLDGIATHAEGVHQEEVNEKDVDTSDTLDGLTLIECSFVDTDHECETKEAKLLLSPKDIDGNSHGTEVRLREYFHQQPASVSRESSIYGSQSHSRISTSSLDSEFEFYYRKDTKHAKKSLHKVKNKYETLLRCFEGLATDQSDIEDELSNTKSCYDLILRFKKELEEDLMTAREHIGYLKKNPDTDVTENKDDIVTSSDKVSTTPLSCAKNEPTETVESCLEEKTAVCNVQKEDQNNNTLSETKVDSNNIFLYHRLISEHSENEEELMSFGETPHRCGPLTPETGRVKVDQGRVSQTQSDHLTEAIEKSEKKEKRREKITLAAIENAEIKKELLLTKLEKIRLEAVLSCVMMTNESVDMTKEFKQLSQNSVKSLTTSRSTLCSSVSCAHLPTSTNATAFQTVASPFKKYNFTERFPACSTVSGLPSTITPSVTKKKKGSTNSTAKSVQTDVVANWLMNDGVSTASEATGSEFDISSMSDFSSPRLMRRVSPCGQDHDHSEGSSFMDMQDLDDLLVKYRKKEKLSLSCIPFFRKRHIKKQLKELEESQFPKNKKC